jgi:hypothetical protein
MVMQPDAAAEAVLIFSPPPLVLSVFSFNTFGSRVPGRVIYILQYSFIRQRATLSKSLPGL